MPDPSSCPDAPPDDDEPPALWPILRPLLLPYFAPGLLRAAGQMTLNPFVALYARELGATDSGAGAAVSMVSLATFCLSPAAGLVSSRLGLRLAMGLGVCVNICAALVGAAAGSYYWLVASRLLQGVGNVLFQISRQTFLTAVVPKPARGRASALQAFTLKAGGVVGPTIGGSVSHRVGLPSLFWLAAAVHAATLALLWLFFPRGGAAAAAGTARPSGPAAAAPPSVRAMLCRPPVLCAAPAVMALALCGGLRGFLLPLKCAALGLELSGTGLVSAFSFSCDLLFVPLSGLLLDHAGRKAAATTSRRDTSKTPASETPPRHLRDTSEASGTLPPSSRRRASPLCPAQAPPCGEISRD